MEFILISVKDKVTGEMMNPVPVHNTDEAKRLFTYQLKNNPVWKENIEQFEIYDLGLFDTETGNIIGNNLDGSGNPLVLHPELICKGTDLLESRKE